MVMMMIDNQFSVFSSFLKNFGNQALKYLTPQLSNSSGSINTTALLGDGTVSDATYYYNQNHQYINEQPNNQQQQQIYTNNFINGNSVYNDQQQQYIPHQQQHLYYEQPQIQQQFLDTTNNYFYDQSQDLDRMLCDTQPQQSILKSTVASSSSSSTKPIDSFQDIISTIPIHTNNGNGSTDQIIIPTDINFYVYKVLSWLINHDSSYIINYYNSESMELIKYALECSKNVLIAHEIPMSIFPLVLYYADKFVQRCGINHKQIFNLLLISSVMCVKFWGETVRVDYQVLGKYFNFNGKDLCYMERLFLNGINFELYVHNDLIKEFLVQLENEKESFESKCEFL